MITIMIIIMILNMNRIMIMVSRKHRGQGGPHQISASSFFIGFDCNHDYYYDYNRDYYHDYDFDYDDEKTASIKAKEATTKYQQAPFSKSLLFLQWKLARASVEPYLRSYDYKLQSWLLIWL